MDKFFHNRLTATLMGNDNIDYFLRWIHDSGITLTEKATINAKKQLYELINIKITGLTNSPDNEEQLQLFHQHINQLVYEEFIQYIRSVFPNIKVTITDPPSTSKNTSMPSINGTRVRVITEEEKQKLLSGKNTTKTDDILELLSNPMILSMFVAMIENLKTLNKNSGPIGPNANGVYTYDSAMRKLKEEGGRLEKIVTKEQLDKIINAMNSDDSDEDVSKKTSKKKNMSDNEENDTIVVKKNSRNDEQGKVHQRDVKIRKAQTGNRKQVSSDRQVASSHSKTDSRENPQPTTPKVTTPAFRTPKNALSKSSDNDVIVEKKSLPIKQGLTNKNSKFEEDFVPKKNVKHSNIEEDHTSFKESSKSGTNVNDPSRRVATISGDTMEKKHSQTKQSFSKFEEEEEDDDEIIIEKPKAKQFNKTNDNIAIPKNVPMQPMDNLISKMKNAIPNKNQQLNNHEEEDSNDELIDGIIVSSEDETYYDEEEEFSENEELIIVNPNIDFENLTIDDLPAVKEELERLSYLKKEFSYDTDISSEITKQISNITLAFSSLKKKTKDIIDTHRENIEVMEQATDGEIFDLEFNPKTIDPKKTDLSFNINKRVTSFFLVKYYLPRSKNNINRFNNKFAVNYNGRVRECVIPIGNYDSLQPIIAFILSELEFITLELTDGKLIMQTNDRSNFDLINNQSSIFPLLGFTKTNNSEYKNKFCYISDSEIDLSINDKVYLHIANFVDNLELETNKDIDIMHALKTNSVSILIRQLIFRFKSKNGQPYDFPEKFRISFKAIYPNR